MKKEWVMANIEELEISATKEAPTTELEFDLYTNGSDGKVHLTQGGKTGSGPSVNVPYHPN